MKVDLSKMDGIVIDNFLKAIKSYADKNRMITQIEVTGRKGSPDREFSIGIFNPKLTSADDNGKYPSETYIAALWFKVIRGGLTANEKESNRVHCRCWVDADDSLSSSFNINIFLDRVIEPFTGVFAEQTGSPLIKTKPQTMEGLKIEVRAASGTIFQMLERAVEESRKREALALEIETAFDSPDLATGLEMNAGPGR
jgi:hypothetical protein